MDKSWLQKKTTIAEAEQQNLVTDSRLGPHPVPFGFTNGEWQKFKSQIKDGDELWAFCSPQDSWANLCGRMGLCIIRDGEIIAVFTTMMN